MLYLLTQHSLWNRKHSPFLLCSCKRGLGVVNNDTHECEILPHEEQVRLFDRSERRMRLKSAEDSSYDDKYRSWVDENNKGVSHYGIHPDLLPRHSIRFDTFHMKCSITRRLMSTVRGFMLNQSTDVIALFSQSVLKKFWNDYHLYLWNNNKSFSSMVGNELALFVASTEDIVKFFNDNFVQTDNVKHMCVGLKTCVKLFKFLGITYLGDDMSVDEYKEELNVFKNNLKTFYDAGKDTYLSSALGDVGEGETFYMHTLRY